MAPPTTDPRSTGPADPHGTEPATPRTATPRLLLDLVPRERPFGLDEILHLALAFQLLRRRRWRRWRLVRRDPHVPVMLEPGAGRDQPAHRDVLLQPAQVVDLPRDRRLGQDPGRLLERRRG